MATPGETIRSKRIALGMTPQELADLVGVSRKTVYGWENGVSIPDHRYYGPISKALHISLDQLFDLNMISIVLSEDEERIITAYRSHPEMQRSVRKLLDLEKE